VPDEDTLLAMKENKRLLDSAHAADTSNADAPTGADNAAASSPSVAAAAAAPADVTAELAGTSVGPETAAGSAAQLARASAASDASRSSGVGSSTAAELLRSAPAASAPAPAVVAAPSRQPVSRRLKGWFVRYLLKPVFGFDPATQGEWVPPDGYAVRSVELRLHYLVHLACLWGRASPFCCPSDCLATAMVAGMNDMVC
jgi:hypothetical protein